MIQVQPAGLPLAGSEILIGGVTATQGGCNVQYDKIILHNNARMCVIAPES